MYIGNVPFRVYEDMYYILIIVLTIILSATSVPLAYYVLYVAEQDCAGCEKKGTCFARKDLFHGKSNVVSEFMLVAFLNVRKQCCAGKRAKTQQYIWFGCTFILISGLLLWSGGNNIQNVLYIISAGMLLALSIVDWMTQYIPVEYTCIIFVCGLIHLFADYSNWLQYLIGLIAVSGFLCVTNWIATPFMRRRYGEEISSVIGDGDIKLMAATGLLLGWKLNFIALGIGCVAGSVIHLIIMKIKESGRQFAFGPYLSLGVYITMICGEQLVGWYLGMLGM